MVILILRFFFGPLFPERLHLLLRLDVNETCVTKMLIKYPKNALTRFHSISIEGSGRGDVLVCVRVRTQNRCVRIHL